MIINTQFCTKYRPRVFYVYHEGYRSVTVMLGVSHVEVCISARFAGGGGRFHTVVFLIQYILHKDKT